LWEVYSKSKILPCEKGREGKWKVNMANHATMLQMKAILFSRISRYQEYAFIKNGILWF